MKIKARAILSIFLFSFVFSQAEIDTYIQEVEKGDIKNALDSLSSLRQKYPEKPSLLYLEAMLMVDTKESIKLYKELFKRYEDSEYADDAIMKIAEYYYTDGSYESSGVWLNKLHLYYSKSEHANRAINMYLRSLILSGRKDTARIYLKAFDKKYPDLAIDDQLKDNLKEIDPEAKEVDQESAKEETKDKSSILQKVEDIASSITAPNKNRKDHYSIQVGAYSSMQNAIKVRDELQEAGFNARIDLIYLETKNKNLYAVREGYFTSKEYAKNTRKKIQSTTGYPCIIIDINKY